MYFVVFFQVKISTIQLPIQVKISILNVTHRYSFIKIGKTSLLHKFANIVSLKNVCRTKGGRRGYLKTLIIYTTQLFCRTKSQVVVAYTHSSSE